MQIQFTAEQEEQLREMAARAGVDPARLVEDAIVRLLDDEARYRRAVSEGIAQADRGEFLEEEQMDVRFEAMLRS